MRITFSGYDAAKPNWLRLVEQLVIIEPNKKLQNNNNHDRHEKLDWLSTNMTFSYSTNERCKRHPDILCGFQLHLVVSRRRKLKKKIGPSGQRVFVSVVFFSIGMPAFLRMTSLPVQLGFVDKGAYPFSNHQLIKTNK